MFQPPFGRICVELFSKHQNKQIQEGGVFFFQPPKWLLRGTTYLDKQKARLIHHLEMMKTLGCFFVVFLLFLVCFGLSSEIVTSSVIDNRRKTMSAVFFCKGGEYMQMSQTVDVTKKSIGEFPVWTSRTIPVSSVSG